jgi:hypothetical protein
VPVGVALPLGPLTLTVTFNNVEAARLCDAGLTVNVGVNWVEEVTVTSAVPVDVLYVDELVPSGV